MTRCKLQAKKCKFWDNTNIEERFIEQLIIGAISRKPPPKKTGPVKEKFCKRCGLTHSKYLSESCPAWGSTCYVCGKANHWGRMCNTTKNPNSGDKGGHKAGSRVKPKTKFAPRKQKLVNAMQNEEWLEEEDPFKSVNFDSWGVHSE